jgi:tetratricopeptide (TPR) repeat protein
MFEAASARAKVLHGNQDIDVSELFRYYRHNKFKAFDGWMARYISEILLNLSDEYISDAEEWLKQAIEADRGNKMMWYLGRDYALYAELFKRKRKPSEARESLKKAISIFRECRADGWLKKAEKELTTISQ